MATQQPPQNQPHQRQFTGKLDLPTLQASEIEQAKPGPQSPQLEKDAQRAMSHTAGWQPSLAPIAGRGQGQQQGGGGSWGYRQEDRRREVQMGFIGGEGERGGFSEGQGQQ
ncbi:hypothetical protein F4678DRAFT_149153 [Xylaria arbuscula]|nr:hypothetical protein F4678DRAFT_149153 [Xylaria arbuscula]